MSFLRKPACGKSSAVALLAAWLVLLQSILTPWQANAHPALDAFGNPLCITSNSHDGGHGNDPANQPANGCCTWGCAAGPQWLSGAAIGAPAVPAVSSRDYLASTQFPARRDKFVIYGQPRAPPAKIGV